ncbi:MAG: WD40-repeat-containing domain protein, partial [Olpidium bornovanus]
MTPKTPRRPAAARVHAVAGYSAAVSARASPTSPFAASPSPLAVLSPLQKMKPGAPGDDGVRPLTPRGIFGASVTPSRSVGKSAHRRLRSSKRRTAVACEITSVTPAQPSPGGIVKRGAICRGSLHRAAGPTFADVSRKIDCCPLFPASPPPVSLSRPTSAVQYDRFVPDRSAMCLASAHLSISRREPGKEEYLNSGNLAYQEGIARACGLALDKRILMFKSEPPRSEGDEFRTTFSRPVRVNRPAASIRRRILQTPERVLDAPGMVDDYYLNLLDWSCRNMLAVGLDRSVYLWNADSGDVLPLCTSTTPEPITSLRWVADGSHLAIGTYEGDTQIWDVEAQAKVRSMTGHQARVGVLAWNEHILSSGCRDGSIHNHDVRVAQHRVAELLSHTGEVCGLAWKSDGHQLASGANDNLINIWDVSSSLPRFTKSDHTAAVKVIQARAVSRCLLLFAASPA